MRFLTPSFKFTILACFTFVVLTMSVQSVPVWAQEHALHILHDEPLALDLKPVGTANGQTNQYVVSAPVLVRNDGEQLDMVNFSVAVPTKPGEVAPVTVDLDPSQPQDKSIDGFAIKEFDLQFSVDTPPNSLTAYLVIKAEEGGVVPGTMQLTLNKPGVSRVLLLPSLLSWSENMADGLMIISFAVAAGITIIAGIYLKLSSIGFTNPLQTVTTFSLNDSWASTLTAVGGVLGTVLATGVLSQSTQILSKQNYAGLYILFSLLILVAGVIFNIKKAVGVLLLTAGISLWATFGQLLTTMLLLGEIDLQGTLSTPLFWVLQVMVIVAFVCVSIYGLFTIPSRVQGGPVAANGAPPAAQPRAALL